jgi:hypothetical protein
MVPRMLSGGSCKISEATCVLLVPSVNEPMLITLGPVPLGHKPNGDCRRGFQAFRHLATVDPLCWGAAQRARRGRFEKDGQAINKDEEMIEAAPGWRSKDFDRKQENPPWMQHSDLG